MITIKNIICSAVALFAFVCFTLSATVQAQLPPPPPDGGYPNENTAEGDGALSSLTAGMWNTALGFNALTSTTNGSFNTAIGDSALSSNISGGFNTATGVDALSSNISGGANTATGDAALASNTTGQENTATGTSALLTNTTGSANTATGLQALSSNTTGFFNTATGSLAMNYNSTGHENTATGVNALLTNTTGNDNTAIGLQALQGNTTGDNTIALGVNAGANLTTGNNNIDIGNFGMAGESNTIRIGGDVGVGYGSQTATYIAGIRGVPVTHGMPIGVNPNGQIGVKPSSARYKDAIRPMDKASEAILALKPVTFRYKKELDPESIPQFGLVAEEVAKVNPDLVIADDHGKPFTVRYEEVNAMLLNEFLKEHKNTEKLEATVASLVTTVKEQAAQIQKVSARLEASKPASQVVNNP